MSEVSADALLQAIQSLEKKIDTRLSSIEKKIDTRLSSIETRISKIEISVGELEGNVARILKVVSHENADFKVHA